MRKFKRRRLRPSLCKKINDDFPSWMFTSPGSYRLLCVDFHGLEVRVISSDEFQGIVFKEFSRIQGSTILDIETRGSS